MRKLILGMGIVYALLTTTACYYHQVPEDFLYENVSYQSQVKPILEAKCYSCHTPGAVDPNRPIGGPYWDDFAMLQAYATAPSGINGTMSILVARIKGVETPQMPYLAAPLTRDEIRIIESWCVMGAPNN